MAKGRILLVDQRVCAFTSGGLRDRITAARPPEGVRYTVAGHASDDSTARNQGLMRVISTRSSSSFMLTLIPRSHVRQACSSDAVGRSAGMAGLVYSAALNALEAGTLQAHSDGAYPCYRLWLTFTVLWDGRVSLCCADFDGRHVLGDLNTSSIREIWNAEPYVKATLESVLAQRGVDLEVVVVDDGSTDDTRAVSRRLAGEDARVRVVRLDRNTGSCGAARNAARSTTRSGPT